MLVGTHVVHVAEFDAPEDLEDVAAGLVEAEPLGVLLQLLQDGVVDVLEDQEQLAPPPKHLDQVDQVLVAQSLQNRRVKFEGGVRTTWGVGTNVASSKCSFTRPDIFN